MHNAGYDHRSVVSRARETDAAGADCSQRGLVTIERMMRTPSPTGDLFEGPNCLDDTHTSV